METLLNNNDDSYLNVITIIHAVNVGIFASKLMLQYVLLCAIVAIKKSWGITFPVKKLINM